MNFGIKPAHDPALSQPIEGSVVVTVPAGTIEMYMRRLPSILRIPRLTRAEWRVFDASEAGQKRARVTQFRRGRRRWILATHAIMQRHDCAVAFDRARWGL